MEEVDAIIIPILKEVGCKIENSITSVKSFDGELFYHVIAFCLSIITPNNSNKLPFTLPGTKAGRFRVCSQLANQLKEIGFTGDLGFETFLYPNEPDVRKMCMFVVDKLPREEKRDDVQPQAGPESIRAKAIADSLGKWINVSWSPYWNRISENVQEEKENEEKEKEKSFFSVNKNCSVVSLSVPLNESTPEMNNYYGKATGLPLVSAQPVRNSILMPSLFELNTKLLLESSESEWRWANPGAAAAREEFLSNFLSDAFRGVRANGRDGMFGSNRAQDFSSFSQGKGLGLENGSSTFSRRALFEEESSEPSKAAFVNEHGALSEIDANKQSSSSSKEEEEARLKAEREALLQQLSETLNELLAQQAALSASQDQNSSATRQAESDLQSLNHEITELENAYKLRQKVVALLPDGEKNLNELKKLVSASSEKLVALATEWENHRLPLLQKLRRQQQLLQERKLEVGRKLEIIKKMRDDMRNKANELREKDKLFKAVSDELASLPKTFNRQVYVRRIMDIMKNYEKQKIDIKKVLVDVKRLQKEINLVSESSKRCFALADEVVFSSAKKSPPDPIAVKAYKYVVQLRDGFVELVSMVESTGKTSNEAKDIQSQFDELETRNTNLNMERILNDLAQIKKENKALAAKRNK